MGGEWAASEIYEDGLMCRRLVRREAQGLQASADTSRMHHWGGLFLLHYWTDAYQHGESRDASVHIKLTAQAHVALLETPVECTYTL